MNNELKLLLKNSFLGELLKKGITIFTFNNGELFYEESKTVLKADIKITTDNVLNFIKEIALIFGGNFDDFKPLLNIKTNEITFVATMPPFTDLSFHLNISKEFLLKTLKDNMKEVEKNLEPKFELDFDEVIQFMESFQCNFINSRGELIIDHKTNTFTNFENCKTIKDLEAKVLMAVSSALSGDEQKKRKYLLVNLNRYFKTNLSFDDMEMIYSKLCYFNKIEENKLFIAEGFPMEELLWSEYK